jgi:autotransporter passenger strand-loop-strand repeat protein
VDGPSLFGWLSILSGGEALNFTVKSGAQLTVNGGATVSGLTVSSGGAVRWETDASLAGAVLDNLGSHKARAARAAVRARGARLFFLPPYSPDLNPTEQVFSKLKHLVRKAQPRDVTTTWRKVGQLLDLFSPQECANYLINAGYGSV